MKKIRLVIATAFLAMAAVTSSFAQQNLGADCGCPAVNARGTAINLSSFVDVNGLLTSSIVLTCDKNWTLDTKVYVPWGKSITIMPGTVVKATESASADLAHAIVVMRGGKIYASGSKSCPIVLTASDDPMDPASAYPMTTKGKWGGIVLLGRAKNNLIGKITLTAPDPDIIVAKNTSCVADDSTGIGWIEGYPASNPYNHYGMPRGLEVDNDNSGIMTYVSIRHAGAIVTGANELNGLSLGSVGSGTVIDNIEIIANADDGIEFFGGTVNVKHIAMYWGNDDMFDWDQGWNGSGQFLFGIACPDINLVANGDNGFETDGDDNTKGSYAGAIPGVEPVVPFISHPYICNATLIGSARQPGTSDFSGPAAIQAKERTEGEIYNSVFAGFKYGLDLADKRGSQLAYPAGPDPVDSYQNWLAGSLVVKNNTFTTTWGGLTSVTVNGSTRVAGSAADQTKFITTDKNVVLDPIPGFSPAVALNAAGTAILTQYDAIPLPELGNTFPVNTAKCGQTTYRGAFPSSGSDNWLADWSYAKLENLTKGLVENVNDVDRSGGLINGDDVLQVVGAFGTGNQK